MLDDATGRPAGKNTAARTARRHRMILADAMDYAVDLNLWVPRTSSSSHDQVIFVDQTTGASLLSDAVLLKIDRFG